MYRKLVGTDGSVRLKFDVWYDVERDEPCIVQRMKDGKMRCVPELGFATTSGDPGNLFQDDACTLSVMAFTTPSSPASCNDEVHAPTTKRYVYLRSPGRCEPTRLAEFPSTPKLATKTLFKKEWNGSCTAIPTGTEALEVFAWTPLHEIDPAEFALVTVSDDTAAGKTRLRDSRTIHSGADGSKAVASFQIVDGERNEFCAKQIDVDGAYRCMPQGRTLNSNRGGFSDADCKTNALRVSPYDPPCDGLDARDTTSRNMTRTDYVSCRTEVFPFFTASPLSTVYSQSDTCKATSTSGSPILDYSSQALPSPIGPSNFSPLAHVARDAPPGYYGKSGTRLTLRQSGEGSPDGFESMRSVDHYDNALKAPCTPTVLDDGKTYCVTPFRSQSYNAWPLYADDACADPVALFSKNNGCDIDASDVPKLLSANPDRQCWMAFSLYRGGAPVTLKKLYERRLPDTECQASGWSLIDFDVYRVRDLTKVPNSNFVELTMSFVK